MSCALAQDVASGTTVNVTAGRSWALAVVGGQHNGQKLVLGSQQQGAEQHSIKWLGMDNLGGEGHLTFG